MQHTLFCLSAAISSCSIRRWHLPPLFLPPSNLGVTILNGEYNNITIQFCTLSSQFLGSSSTQFHFKVQTHSLCSISFRPTSALKDLISSLWSLIFIPSLRLHFWRWCWLYSLEHCSRETPRSPDQASSTSSVLGTTISAGVCLAAAEWLSEWSDIRAG